VGAVVKSEPQVCLPFLFPICAMSITAPHPFASAESDWCCARQKRMSIARQQRAEDYGMYSNSRSVSSNPSYRSKQSQSATETTRATLDRLTTMAQTRSHAELLASQNLYQIFNERDRLTRIAAMERTYSPSIVFYDPGEIFIGYEAIDKFVQNLLDANQSWQFKAAGPVWTTQAMVMMEWTFGPASAEGGTGEEGVRGNDVMIIGEDGRIEKIWTMIKGVSDSE